MNPIPDRETVLPSVPPVLRIAFAGTRRLPYPAELLAARCQTLFDQICDALASQWPLPSGSLPPRLVLLTGLADGADQVAASAFLAAPPDRVLREHVAMLPFREPDYRDNSPIDDKPEFDRLIGRSSLVIELDGRWLPNDAPEGEAFARHVRGRAYRSQARTMLQRADLLLAVWDPVEPGRAGGTAETVRHALDAGIAVRVLCQSPLAGDLALYDLGSIADLDALQSWDAVVPFIPASEQKAHIESLVRDLAPGASPLPAIPARSWLEGIWRRFEKKFESNIAAPSPVGAAVSTTGSPFHALRQHARNLNARYAGRYRGGFLNNFRFAAMATTLAALSLALMVLGYKFLLSEWPTGFKVVLLVLAFGKLGLVVTIWRVTERARHSRWNEHAVNARHLAENLRLMFWVPALGKLRVPQRSGEHHADAHIGRNAVEALLRAAVRAAPLETGFALIAGPEPRRARIEPVRALDQLRNQWIVEQQDYHGRNAERLGRMARALTERAEVMNWIVIVCVALDIVLLIAGITLDHLPIPLDVSKVLLITAAAALPAAVAATYGIREQSEASRLSGRSEQLRVALAGLKADVDQLLERMGTLGGTAQDPGAWTLECLDRAEQCARLVAEDVAEWSVLYGKGMPAI